jgi:hypothetical protein
MVPARHFPHHEDTRPVIHRVLQWADNVSQGRKDIRKTETPAEFVPGGTIGPVA